MFRKRLCDPSDRRRFSGQSEGLQHLPHSIGDRFLIISARSGEICVIRHTPSKSNNPMNAFRSSIWSGREMNSPKSFLSSLEELRKNLAMALTLFSSSVPGSSGSGAMMPFFSRNAMPFFGFWLNMAAPWRKRALRDFCKVRSWTLG